MICQSIIPVSELLDNAIHTREAVSILMNAIEDKVCSDIELDFSGVEHISRSFADQFHFEKLQFVQTHGKRIIVTNANEDVVNMLQAVARTQHKVDREYQRIPVYKYSDRATLNNFLLSL